MDASGSEPLTVPSEQSTPSAIYTTLTTTLAFTLTGGGDVATINGAATILPEPATLLLVGGALLMGGLRRRRSS